ncbi:MAG TPA: amidohydrolase [Gaiellaceae bacterium]|nr:amidohydrolase [Gaiellaceae bacterium]
MILENGTIRTLDPALPLARALAIAGDRIAGGVGVHETALASPETVDLDGRTVLPGFTDSHVHFPSWAVAQYAVKLDGCSSLEEVLARVRDSNVPGAWLGGSGWRSGDWTEGREPTKEDLDAVTGERPAALMAKDGHSLWLNSAGLAVAGGDLEVEGGVVERDASGYPTGVLREESAWRFEHRYMTIPDDEYVTAMRAGVKIAHARGVTCVHDKDGGLGAAGLWQELDPQLRVWQSVPGVEALPALEALKLRSGLGSLLRVGYLKMFMDGTLGSQTAWMLDDSGVRITSGDELAEVVRRAAELGWPVGVHAIGDKANREALDAFERTRDVWEPKGLRQRIEHAQCLAPEDVARFAQIGVTASVQFSHAPSDEHLAKKFWPDKLEQTYSWRSLLDSGALLANGSDAPVEELDPWAGVVAGVLGHWREDQRVTLEEALHATCVAPNWLSHDERARGTLIPGRAADLVVLDRDPFADDTDLREVQVEATMVAGRWVHNPPPWD